MPGILFFFCFLFSRDGSNRMGARKAVETTNAAIAQDVRRWRDCRDSGRLVRLQFDRGLAGVEQGRVRLMPKRVKGASRPRASVNTETGRQEKSAPRPHLLLGLRPLDRNTHGKRARAVVSMIHCLTGGWANRLSDFAACAATSLPSYRRAPANTAGLTSDISRPIARV